MGWRRFPISGNSGALRLPKRNGEWDGRRGGRSGWGTGGGPRVRRLVAGGRWIRTSGSWSDLLRRDALPGDLPVFLAFANATSIGCPARNEWHWKADFPKFA